MEMRSEKLKSAISNIFKLKNKTRPDQAGPSDEETDYNGLDEDGEDSGEDNKASSPFVNRALPPLPANQLEEDLEGSENVIPLSEEEENAKILDYAASIERVKNCGWYWGPVSGEMAEKLLSNEPDGSFIVRDSSDEHYIFSLTFKLNGLVRHVRIEHDQGKVCLGLNRCSCLT